eukprot:1495782-Ditylum_brightwellii.AAC.1
MERGIVFLSQDYTTVTSFLNLLFKEVSILTLCDAKWGPQNTPKGISRSAEMPMETLCSILGFLVFRNGGSISCGTQGQKCTALSSYEAEVNVKNMCAKNVQHLH